MLHKTIRQLQYSKYQDRMFFTLPIIIAILIAVVALLLLLQPQSLTKHSLQDRAMRNQFKSSKHKWEKSELKSFYFCYLCNKLTNGWWSDVLECKKCGIIIHKICRYVKLRKPDCKYLVARTDSPTFYHQWRQCSYSSSTNCSVCNTVCTGLECYNCLWCNRTRHGLCTGEKQCDFGPLRKFILEPTMIKCTSVNFTTDAFKSLRRMRNKRKDKKEKGSESQSEKQDMQKDVESQVDKIVIKCSKEKQIIVVLINKKSGGQVGNEFIKAFYRVLNPLQVISILDEGLQKLRLFVDIPNLFLLIAGGDGTVCSVLNFVKTIPQWQLNNPPAAILPLGTGNDLSRSLGWGGSVQDVDAGELLKEIAGRGRQEVLDRWKMTAVAGDQKRQFTIYNYIGMGLDGRICKNFHQMREKYPHLFFSQFSNKLIYTHIGSADIFTPLLSLSTLVTMTIDGKPINIEGYQNIIFLNIKHWGGGVTDLWRSGSSEHWKADSFSDGMMEVIGLTDVIHMGQVQVGMDQPFQLGQGRKIQLVANSPNAILPFQIDGEPLEMQGPVSITIELKDQVNILATSVQSEQSKIMGVLQKSLKEGIIDQNQFQKMLKISRDKDR